MRVGRHLTEFVSRAGERRNPLTALANRVGSDKGNWHFHAHDYTRIYEPLFAPLRDQPVRFLEIGLLNAVDRWSWTNRHERLAGGARGARAPSLEMWLRYFPQATVFGFDINDFSGVQLDRCLIVRGDMGSEADLARLVRETGGRFDIVLEDASHASHHQQIALGFLFEHLVPGGLYMIEDLGEQPAWMERPDVRKTRDLLRHAQRGGDFESPCISKQRQAFLAANVASIRLYDSHSRKDALNTFDALAVIQRKG
jgi:hypothetical protein